MQAILEGMNAGLKIPKIWPEGLVKLFAIVISGILAAIIFQVDSPGSAIALYFALPFVLVLNDWLEKQHSPRAHVLPVMACLSLLGVALEPGVLNLAVTWCLLAATAIAARGSIDVVALPVLTALVRNFVSGPLCVFLDGRQAARTVHTHAGHMPRPPMASLVLPLVAVGIFTLLLASANPVIENLLLALHFDQPWQFVVTIFDTVFNWSGIVFLLTALLLWPILQGQTLLRETVVNLEGTAPLWHRLFFKPATVIVTLLLLNLLFATENALDVWHVWMKAALPDGMTHAAYVHRGSYTLIVTAILAGLLMVFALWKGTVTEQSPLVRVLVYLWTAQNLMLVASSAKRTFDYIDAYGWTEWRLAGLLWMGLVFSGLAGIIWRVARNRDGRWLVNINLVATCMLLLFCSLVDLRGFVARQNLQIALTDPSRQVDFAYLRSLGPSSIDPLKSFAISIQRNLERSSRPPIDAPALFKAHNAVVVAAMLKSEHDFVSQDWRSWTWRFANLASNPAP